MHLLHAICDCADDNGRAYPSVNYLVWKSNLPKATVKLYLAEFRRQGIVVPVGRRSEIERSVIANSERDTSVVNINLDLLPRKSVWRKPQTEKHQGGPAVGLRGASGNEGGGPATNGGWASGDDRNKEEPSVEPSYEPSEGQNHHAYGAVNPTLQTWLKIKASLRERIAGSEYNLWLRPMYFFKELSGGVLLLTLPPNKQVVAAARLNRALITNEIQAHGLQGFSLTGYPDNDVLLQLSHGNSEWAEAANRILSGRVASMERQAITKKAPQAVSA